MVVCDRLAGNAGQKTARFSDHVFSFRYRSRRCQPECFAPKQLIIAHAALCDPAVGQLLHDQRIAREGFGLAYAKEGNTDVKLDDWQFRAMPMAATKRARCRDFTLTLC